MTDIDELRRLAQAALAGPDGISLNWIKLIQDFQQNAGPATILELLDRLEAAEKERDALRAKIAEMERQEPVAEIGQQYTLLFAGSGSITGVVKRHGLKIGDKLYALPGAQPAPSVPEGWIQRGMAELEAIRSRQDDDTLLDDRTLIERIGKAMLAAAPEAKP